MITFKELQALRKKYEDDNHFVAIAGNPMHIGYIESYVPGAIRIFGYTILAFLVLFYVFFRSTRGTIMPVFAALLSAVWGLGFLALMNFNLDPLVLVFPFLIGALTACHAVQVVKRYKEEVYHLGDTKVACKKIISSLFVPGVGGAITDSTGILIICITPIPYYPEDMPGLRVLGIWHDFYCHVFAAHSAVLFSAPPLAGKLRGLCSGRQQLTGQDAASDGPVHLRQRVNTRF